MAHCPECEAILDLDVEDVEEGQLVSCPDCGVELEVVNTNPVELDLAEDDDEEDDEDDTEDDDLDYEEEEEEDDDDEDIEE
jgi:alpha-aminoadipate carrier protein LysW